LFFDDQFFHCILVAARFHIYIAKIIVYSFLLPPGRLEPLEPQWPCDEHVSLSLPFLRDLASLLSPLLFECFFSLF